MEAIIHPEMHAKKKEKNRKLVSISFQGSESKLQYILLITRKEIISYELSKCHRALNKS